MKRKLKRWTFRMLATGLLMTTLLLIVVLNPVLTYANKTRHRNVTIYHNQKLDAALLTQLDRAAELLKTSEFYNADLRLDVCLNDGSAYPKLLRTLRGPAFGWGFYNKVVLQGSADGQNNFVELNGYKWNLTQLLAHEMTHCLQFDKLGLWKSKPVADVPNWKWEGYAEYVSRQGPDQKDLTKNLSRLLRTGQTEWAVLFDDGTVSPKDYYAAWILVQFCLAEKKMTYPQLLADTTSEQTVRQELMNWYNSGKQK